jgi:SecD/SecF fusion protein
MFRFSRIKSAAIWAVCALGVLMSLPNFMPPGVLPGGLPRFNLGLDLQGGAYLLLEVDAEAMVKERLDATIDAVRPALRQANIGYRDLAVSGRSVMVTVPDAAQRDAARGALQPLLSGLEPGHRDFTLEEDGTRLRLTLGEEAVQRATTRAADQSVEIVRRRIDETGVNEPVVARQGADRIPVQLPGLQDPGRIKRLLGQTAKMTFHLVAETAGAPGTRALPSTDGYGKVTIRQKIELDGARLRDAQASLNQTTNEWVVQFSFDPAGAKRFAEITRSNVGRPFAIVLDDKVISSPVIREPITGGQGQISGSFSAQSANDLAVLLRAGALPAPLTVMEERTVGPDLGADAIRGGLIACAVGFALVVGYMAVSYGLFGVFANIALFFNLALTLAALSALQATLTLPGIAGLLLTLGLSVDANILINERIREERRKGVSPQAAMDTGFRRAFATITDSNLTTLIKMALLYFVGTGTVKGFAVTISLGILTSMFTATVVARWMTVAWFRRRRPAVLPVENRPRLVPDGTRIPFMRGRNLGLIASLLISLASVGLFVYPGLNYGVDFAGGTVIEARGAEPVDFGDLREKLSRLEIGPVTLQQFGGPNDVLIRFERQAGGDAAQQAAVQRVQETLMAELPGTTIQRVESVGSSVSGELFQSGMLALGLAAVAMLLYITVRFEWPFGVGAVTTMILDVTKTVGFFALTGMQFNLTAIAAILTVMGYSINDKVVVYDRVRENLRVHRRMPLRELIDLSINETLGRTIGTSLAVFLSVVPLVLLGGEALREFALVLLFGVVLATSSSIFIAAPILLYLGEHRLRHARKGGDPDGEEPQPATETAP